MENATKALLMAAGVFFALMLITVSLFVWKNTADYYTSKEEIKKTEQLTIFNKQYTSYSRDNVRGNDLLTLINKTINFNQTKGIGEKEIEISIEIPTIQIDERTKQFYYKYEKNKNVKLLELGSTYTHSNIKSAVFDKANQIALNYRGIAEKLVANISTLEGDNSSKTREQLLEQLKIDYEVNNDDILRYYQYVQFKRARFDCTETKFNSDGRIERLKFKFNGKFQ